jgi:hypothetical protein
VTVASRARLTLFQLAIPQKLGANPQSGDPPCHHGGYCGRKRAAIARRGSRRPVGASPSGPCLTLFRRPEVPAPGLAGIAERSGCGLILPQTEAGVRRLKVSSGAMHNWLHPHAERGHRHPPCRRSCPRRDPTHSSEVLKTLPRRFMRCMSSSLRIRLRGMNAPAHDCSRPQTEIPSGPGSSTR